MFSFEGRNLYTVNHGRLHRKRQGHIQSLVLGAGLLVIAGILAIGGILADLVATNRLLLEDIRMRVLRAEIETAVHGEMNKHEDAP